MSMKKQIAVQIENVAQAASTKASKELLAHLVRIDENVLITHENQMEIDQRLERIEKALNIKK